MRLLRRWTVIMGSSPATGTNRRSSERAMVGGPVSACGSDLADQPLLIALRRAGARQASTHLEDRDPVLAVSLQ